MTLTTSVALLAAGLPFALHSPDPIVIRHDMEARASIDLAQRFDATAMFVPDGCGTLIGKRWVLTAAHVARGLSPFTPRVRVAGKEYRVRQALFHPDSKSDGRRPPRVDAALVELEEDVVGVTPAALYTRDDEVGKEVFVVGYGDFGPAGGKLARGDGVRRAATNTVERAERGRLHLDFDAPPDGTALEGVGGPGDSGGPLYLETADGLFLAGVSSASMGGRPGAYGVIDVYARVSELGEWIAATRASAAGKPTSGPELRDLTRGFPDGPRGELAAAFFESFAAGEGSALNEFAETFRSEGSRRRNPGAAFTRRMLRLAGELGALTPTRVALVGPERWIVLARSEKAGWRAVHFRFATDEPEVRLDDLGLRVEPAPDASEASDD